MCLREFDRLEICPVVSPFRVQCSEHPGNLGGYTNILLWLQRDFVKLFSLAPFGTYPWLYLSFKKGAAKGAVQTVDFPVVRPAKSNPDPLAFESFPEI